MASGYSHAASKLQSSAGDLQVTTAPVCKRRRDWFRIIRDLMAAGVSMSQIGRICNRTTTTVENWADGSDPKETDARIVLALYAKHCPEQYARHAAEFSIRVEIEAVSSIGEQRVIGFVDVGE